jgi:DNA-binding FadR family transcriptional regulator
VPIEAVESPRLYRQIADQLRGLIERREFPVGSRLPAERELAEKLGVSRPSVREALIALEVEGLVRIRMGSGVYVVDRPAVPVASLPETPSEGPFELLKARELIESAVCVAAADRVTSADLVALDHILARMSEPGLSGDELVALDRRFHISVTGVMRNAVLIRFVGELFDQRINPYFQQLARYFENVASWRAAVIEHRAIRDALAGHNAKAAGEAMARHLRNSQERFSQSFGEAGPINGQAGVRVRPVKQN